jgi:hypothetical protein
MIKAKLREWGIGYSSGYNLFNDGNRSDKFHFTIRDLDEIVFDTPNRTGPTASELALEKEMRLMKGETIELREKTK